MINKVKFEEKSTEESYSITSLNSKVELLKIDPVLNIYILSKIELDEKNKDEILELFSDKILSFGLFNNIEIVSDSREINNVKNKFLERSGFVINKMKGFYEKYLELHKFNYDDIFDYKSIREIGESEFLEVFKKVTEDDPEREVDFRLYYKSMFDDAEDKFNEDWWKVVFLKSQIIGIIMPQVFPDKIEEGSIFYIGFIPEYRNKGYGKILHSKGLEFLKNQGVIRYIGSTLENNNAMNKVFELNECKQIMTRYFYKPKLK